MAWNPYCIWAVAGYPNLFTGLLISYGISLTESRKRDWLSLVLRRTWLSGHLKVVSKEQAQRYDLRANCQN
eukprot:4597349-Pleurochrysis_carterae.AAC.2